MKKFISIIASLFMIAQANAQNGPSFNAITLPGGVINGVTNGAAIPAIPTLPPICVPVTGTLTNANDSVSLTCDAPSYEIMLTPNGATGLSGTLQFSDPVTGSNRALFKQAVGEMDVSSVKLNGTNNTMGYRLVSLKGAKVTLTNATTISGSETVTIYPSPFSVGTFLNNPVHSAEEGALRNGRAWSFSTPVMSVAANSYLNLVITNPATSNCNAFVTLKRFANTSTYSLSFTKLNNPTGLTGTGVVSLTPANRRNDSTYSTGLSITYGMQAAAITTGTPAISSPLYATSDKEITVPDMITPGSSVGFMIGGVGGGLAAAATVGMTFAGYCEVAN